MIKRPTDSTKSTTSGQTDTIGGQRSTKSGKLITTNEKTSTKSIMLSQMNTTNHQTSFASTKSGVVSSAKRVTL